MAEKQMESIWADGVPAKIEEKDLLPIQRILSMCVRFTLEHTLKDKNYEVKGVNDDLHSYPNILLEKSGTLYAVAVAPCVFPRYVNMDFEVRRKYVENCKGNKAVPVLCPVLFCSYDKQRAEKGIVLNGDLYNMKALGQVILTEDPNQSILPKDLDFKF